MPISTITHKGKQIVYIDYSNVKTEEEAMETLYAARDFLAKSSKKVRKLNNVTGAFASPKFMSEAKRLNKEILDAKTEKGAIIGISTLQKILLKGFNVISSQKLVPFNNMNDALDYLAK